MSIYNTSNLYSIEVLVNGNTCKQYNHGGKIFIEAKNGSEYEIKINNNSWARKLAVSAVDGLNVLTGETASTEDSGYLINAYDSLRIKGFRYNDDKVGAFKFSSKSKSYASSKGDATNAGVIGVKLFDEVIPSVSFYTSNTGGTTNVTWLPSECNNPTYAGGSCGNGAVSNFISNCDMSSVNIKPMNISEQPRGFDMGTSWGKVKESKVHEVEFKRGSSVFSCDIYYASRESLIEMGVPLSTEVKIAFPESFPKKYATPPENWLR